MNEAAQAALGIQFYLWTTQGDGRVRPAHAGRDGKVLRWDTPPEGGHPGHDYRCRCYAKPLTVEGYWRLVQAGVQAYQPVALELEDSVEHMYLDTRGNVTVGIGSKLDSADAAAKLPFLWRATDLPATPNEIRDEFDIVATQQVPANISARYFRNVTELYLPVQAILDLVPEHMHSDFRGMVDLFPDFGNYPIPVQLALWDMTYNLGLGTLRRDFPSFRAAISAQDWASAAVESHRTGIDEHRNIYVRNLLLSVMEN